MSVIWAENGWYSHVDYEDENDLEESIIKVQNEFFGEQRYYLDIKRKIGSQVSQQSIPDGYLIDLASSKPRLYVVENELASHDPLRHIAVQILKFSLSFETEPQRVKRVLLEGIQNNDDAREACERYASDHNFRNLDHMLEWLVFDSPFAALVIIDQIPEKLENVLSGRFKFGVEVLELARYQNDLGERMYFFSPFLADVSSDIVGSEGIQSASRKASMDEIDTIVVPARSDGFEEVFLAENCWHAIRIHGTMRPQIKYIAAYQVAPVSAITHIAPVKTIEPYHDTAKYIVRFSEPAKEIGPIPLVTKDDGGRVKPLYNLRYTSKKTLELARNLDDVW